ncbi:MAG TPA: hypothetical protein VFX59_00995 [Polyangiales bacterium]|nr:hypothetical protein [Polyangiales bacterium]
MPITALALLRIEKPATSNRVQTLSDGVILHTQLDFSSDPEDLSMALANSVGEALFTHEDPRGIFFIPSVAAPKATSYDAVIAEVGEGGVWGPSPAQLAESVQQTDFGELLGGMLAQLPPSLMSSAQAAISGDRGALDAMTSQLQAMLGGSPALAGLAQQLGGMMDQREPPAGEQLAAIDQAFASVGASEDDQNSLREMVINMQTELMNDPSKLDQLTQQLFGAKKR